MGGVPTNDFVPTLKYVVVFSCLRLHGSYAFGFSCR